MASNKIQSILESVNDKVQRLMQVDRFYVALYDSMRDRMEFPLVAEGDQLIATNEKPWEPRACQKDTWPTDAVIARRNLLLFEKSVGTELKEKELTYWPDEASPKSWLGVPMVFADQVIGALVVENRSKSQAFGDSGVRVLFTIARQTAMAIENARLYERLKRKIGSLQAVNEMGWQLTAGIRLSEEEILNLIYSQASRLMDTKNMYVALYDEPIDTVRFELMYVDGEPRYVKPRKGGKGRTEWIIHNRKPILIFTQDESKAWYDQPEYEEYIGDPLASWVGVPMIVGEKVLGVIATYHRIQNYVYDEDDKQILSLMASQAAIALDNAALVAELKRAQKKIAETEAIITRTSIAADYIHRMNNLAGTIPVWVDLIRGRLGTEALGDERLTSYLDSIEADADRLLRAAERLKSPPKEQDVDIGSTLETLVRQALVQMPANIEVTLDCEDGLPRACAVGTELANSLWSIMENGIEAMPDGGTLKVKAESTVDADGKEWIKVAISDEGKGIAEVDKVFTPFYSTRAGHMGYGLWRAKNVFERIGGSIDFESKEGVGTTFTVKLPSRKEATGHGE